MTSELTPFILRVAKGKKIFEEGDAGSDMYFIHSGRVRIEKNIGGKAEILAFMEKGDFFGEMAVIDPAPRSATAVVEEDAELLKVDAQNFEKLCQNNIEIAVRMIRKYVVRLRDANMRLELLMKDKKQMDREIETIIESTKKAATPSLPLAEFVGVEKGGPTYAIHADKITIGRQDPVTGITPDVDLTSADGTRSVSRRHARLEVVKGQFLLTEEVGVTNGTFVNDQRLKAGIPMTVAPGARVRFGAVEFELKISV